MSARASCPALVMAAAALLGCTPAVAAADTLRLEELRQEVRELQSALRQQARRIEQLERQLARSPPAPAPGAPARAAEGREPPAAPPAWLAPEVWNTVRPGVSALEVVAILGPPTSVRAEPPGRVLFYTLPLGETAFLSGTVHLEGDTVVRVERPVLK
jgi:hypothetical protein